MRCTARRVTRLAQDVASSGGSTARVLDGAILGDKNRGCMCYEFGIHKVPPDTQVTAISTPPSEQSVRELIRRGESVALELKTSVPSVLGLAQLVCGFANTSGGTIIIGVQEPDRIVGCDWPTLSRVLDRALTQLNPVPELHLHQTNIDSHVVGILNVAKSPKVVVSASGVFVREGDRTRAITASEIEKRLAAPGALDTHAIANALAENTATIERLSEQLARSQSFRGQWSGYAIGFVLGILASVIASFIYAALTANGAAQ